MKWNEWFDGNDLEQPYGNGPMSRLRVSLWKWLDVSDLIKPFQNDQNRWEMNELRWIEWNEWIEGFDFVNPMARSLWSVEGVPMKVTWDEWFDQTLSKWSDSMRNEWIEVNRVNRGEMSDLMDLTLWTLWQDPYSRLRVSLWEWLEMSDLIKPYQNDQIQWEMNE